VLDYCWRKSDAHRRSLLFTYRTAIGQEIISLDLDSSGGDFVLVLWGAGKRLTASQAREVGKGRRRSAALDGRCLEGSGSRGKKEESTGDLHSSM
jgi:hypothetical protein